MTHSTLANRFVGRLYTDEGRLHLVLDVDLEAETGRVSCKIDGERQTIDVPLNVIGSHLALGGELKLDSLNAGSKAARTVEKPDGWYFSTREGLKGPYPTDEAANDALNEHILTFQGASAERVAAM